MKSKKAQDTSKSPSIIKQALALNRKPIPWLKAFSAGLAASLPVLIGLLFGRLDYGLLAGLGSFTYLYVFNIPYAQRAKKIFFVVIGITLSAALGTLLAPYPLVTAILMGIIASVAVFIFGALRMTGPSAIFFILVFAMTTGMEVRPDLVFIRAGLVFLGASLSMLIAMLGWFFDPHGPERDVVKRVYLELAELLETVGTHSFNQTKHKVMSTLQEAEETLAAGYIPWRTTDSFKRLYVLNEHANHIFIYIIGNFADAPPSLPRELAQTIREMGLSINKKHHKKIKILQPEQMDEKVEEVFEKVYDADAIMNEPITKINRDITISKPSLKMVLGGAFDKNSIVFITALRLGIVTFIAAFIAYQFDFVRSYWVPLSCVAVMSGSTIVATYHRAIQRGFGTIIGILIASLILALNPSGYMIAGLILLLTFITELFIVKNYGLAAMFFTPNALLMAESTTHGSFSFTYFASARMIDVLIGSLIGLIGVVLIGRRSASSRLPHLISKTLRSHAQLLFVLFSDQGHGFDASRSRELRKMRTNMTNLKTLYSTALGEVPVNQRAVDYYWSIIFSLEQLSYILEKFSNEKERGGLSQDVLAEILFLFENLANHATRKRVPASLNMPKLTRYPLIYNGIINLQNSFHLVSKKN